MSFKFHGDNKPMKNWIHHIFEYNCTALSPVHAFLNMICSRVSNEPPISHEILVHKKKAFRKALIIFTLNTREYVFKSIWEIKSPFESKQIVALTGRLLKLWKENFFGWRKRSIAAKTPKQFDLVSFKQICSQQIYSNELPVSSTLHGSQ